LTQSVDWFLLNAAMSLGGDRVERGSDPGRPLLLQDLGWPKVAGAVAAGDGLCLLPIGATEQHGRHLPIGTDAMIASAICHQASARTGVAVLPTLSYTSSQGHTEKWPGTFALSPRLLIETIVELSRWLRASGFRKLLLVNAHGGNVGPLRVAVDEIRVRGGLQVGLISWFDLSPEISATVYSDGADVHANDAETSLLLHLHPETVDVGAIEDDADRTAGRVFTYTVAQLSRDGVTGFPSRATAAKGSQLFGAVVEALAARIVAARAEEPPSLGPSGVPRVEGQEHEIRDRPSIEER
jgi:creatinine amidohydrolase